jgi:hypothetical protein
VNGGTGDTAALAEFFGRLAEDPALYNNYITDPVGTMRAATPTITEDLIAAVLQGNLRKLSKSFARDSDSVVILGTIVRG